MSHLIRIYAVLQIQLFLSLVVKGLKISAAVAKDPAGDRLI